MALHSLFWAKTRSEAQGAPYKPVGHHLLDVAAVADRFLVLNPGRLRRESALTALLPETHVAFCAGLAALHDLGKISPWFQAQAPEHWPGAVLGAIPAMGRRISHWEATAVLLSNGLIRQTLAARFPEWALGDQVIAAVAGHHGRAPGRDFLDSEAAFHEAAIGKPCLAVAHALCAEIMDLILPVPIARSEPSQIAALSFSLNGLITLADWVGSDTDAFPFEDPATPLKAYWPQALAKAETALRGKGLAPAKPIANPALARLSPRAGATPRPMQKAAAALELDSQPQLVVIEDGTGSGKTEAALLLAARMMAAGLGEGLYVALPTMATANAMHARLETAMGGLFDETAARSASLVLAHGKAGLAKALDRLAAAGASGQGREEAVSERFNAWIGDSRKKALFADAGAGTIDQAFLAILPKKHLTLRQYALAGRILLVDEAHACDAYMGEELKTLVEMQARLGGSVIILSATLGDRMRRDLILAFARGRGIKDRHAGPLKRWSPSHAYPLLTRYAGGDRVEEAQVEALASLSRDIEIRRLPDRESSIALALAAAKRGACAAIVCNAVDSAIAVHAALLAAGHSPTQLTLFHARFAVGDRMEIEEKVLRLFGQASEPQARAGQILVATQVVEQSLDLDFDVMMSDLAPVDLLIQRAGRLWRHDRAKRPEPAPILHVASPEPTMAVEADWLNSALGPAGYTYPLPGVLWRTARDLFEKGRLETPGDLRRLVETAYLAEGNDLPVGLAKAHETSVGKGMAEKFQGQFNTIDPRNGYAGMREVSPDEEIGTRLGEKTVTIRLGRKTGANITPLIRRQVALEAMNWALSEISVRYKWLAGKASAKLPEPTDQALIDTTRGLWPEWERSMPLYVIDDQGILATVTDEGLIYDRSTGLKRAQRPTGSDDGLSNDQPGQPSRS